MSTAVGNLNALYKVAYAKGVEDLIPRTGKITKLVPFIEASMQNGKHFELPVILAAEQGFTYSLDTQAAYDLEDSVGMDMASAEVPGADLVLNSTIGYNQAARALHNATSFKRALSTKFENMLKSAEKRLEINYLHGQRGLADVEIGAFVETGSGATTAVVTLAKDQWAAGIWAGSNNAQLVFYTDSSDTVSAGTNLNANSDANQKLKVDSINTDLRQITVSGSAGAIEDINDISVSKKLRIYYKSSVVGSGATFSHAEAAGLQKIMTNQGTLFGINAAVYDLWKGNSVSITGPLTMAKVLSATAKAVQRGLDSDAVVLVNPDTWADMATDLAALRRFDQSYDSKKAKNGSEVLEYVSQNGTLKIIPYNIVKAGQAFIFPEDKIMRVGARELSLQDPVRGEGEIFFQLPSNAGAGIRTYSNEAIFVEAPAQCVYLSGIANT